MSRRPSTMIAFVGAALVGVAGGLWLARRHDRGHRHDLFSSRPHRRLAALGWLAGEDDPQALALLRDYLAWEPIGALRGRARRIAVALESAA